MSSKQYYSKGKLLLTGEYLVLDGAIALAAPTHLGQSMLVHEQPDSSQSILEWKAYLPDNQIWFTATYDYVSQKLLDSDNQSLAQKWAEICTIALALSSQELQGSYHIQTHLEFPKDWGLGSSSTFIHNLSAWLDINPYSLLEKTIGGSGYDIACADAQSPILYQKTQSENIFNPAQFQNPDWLDKVFFVYLNTKQNSQKAIQNYHQLPKNAEAIERVSNISQELLTVSSLEEAEKLFQEHNQILSQVLQQPSIQDTLFNDYTGVAKYLGAWGGDFALITYRENMLDYCKQKGLSIVIPYEKMIYNNQDNS